MNKVIVKVTEQDLAHLNDYDKSAFLNELNDLIAEYAKADEQENEGVMCGDCLTTDCAHLDTYNEKESE